MFNKPPLLGQLNIPTLQMQKYERYLPTAFDESMSLLEKVNKVIHYLYEYSALTDEMMKRWNEVYEWVMNEGLENAVMKRLQEWLDDGTFERIINEKIFGDLNKKIDDVAKEMLVVLTAFETFKADIKADLDKTFNEMDMEKYKSLYLYNLEQKEITVNQSLNVDEVNKHILTTQAFNDDTGIENFIINRLTMSGKLLDSMFITHGGHGTSIGVENVNGNLFIYSNLVILNGDKTIKTQWLVRFPYRANKTLLTTDPEIEFLVEFPNRFIYQTPIYDDKNKQLGVRITDTTSGSNVTKIEVKNRGSYTQNKYVYNFNSQMNNEVLQGFTIDGDILYVSTGSNYLDFKLYTIDVKNNKVLSTIKGFPNSSQYDWLFGVSEPEGLYLYTNRETNQKTLLCVVSSGAPLRRENRLYAISSNTGVYEFIGKSTENLQNALPYQQDGKAKPIDTTVMRLSDVVAPSIYYMSQSDSTRFTDHPMPNVAGWWLEVTGSDTAGSVIQKLTRNSGTYSTTFTRIVSKGQNKGWENEYIKIPLSGGWSNYYSDGTHEAQYHRYDNTLYISGIVKKSTDITTPEVLYTLPSGYRPAVRQAFIVSTANGMMELTVDRNGEIKLGAYKDAGRNPNFVFINCVVSLSY